MTILEEMITYYNTSKKEDIFHEAIGDILNNLDKVKNSTIYDLAEICYVSTTTISRLCRKLNYNNFNIFKSELINFLENYAYYNRYIPANKVKKDENETEIFFKELNKGIEELKAFDKDYIDKLTEEIHKHKKIVIYNYGPFGSTLKFQTDLIFSGHEIIVPSDYTNKSKDIEAFDINTMAIFIIPAIKEANYLIKLMKKVKDCNSKIFLITSTLNGYFIDYADYHYCFEGVGGYIDKYRMEMFLSLVSIAYRSKYID